MEPGSQRLWRDVLAAGAIPEGETDTSLVMGNSSFVIKGAGIQRLQFIGAGLAGLDQDVHPLARSHHDRIAWLQLVHVGDGDPVHRDDVQSMTFKRDEQVVALGRIQQSPSLHLTRPHVQGRVSHPIVRVVEEASPRRSIEAVGAPDALLFDIGCAEGEGPELLGFLD